MADATVIEVHRIPVSGASPPDDLRVLDASAPGDARDRLGRPQTAIPTGRPLVALVALGEVNSPDVVDPVSIARRDRRFAVDVVVLRFEGILGGNVRAWAILEVSLGALATGRYEVDVVQRPFTFTELDRPSAQTPLAAVRRSHSFVVG